MCFFLSSLERKRELHRSGISSSCPVPWQYWTLGRLDLHETLNFFDSIWITSFLFKNMFFGFFTVLHLSPSPGEFHVYQSNVTVNFLILGFAEAQLLVEVKHQ